MTEMQRRTSMLL